MSKQQISSGYVFYLQRHGKPPLAAHRACLWLERHGFSFGCQFGYANAVEKARAARAGRLKPHPKIATRKRKR